MLGPDFAGTLKPTGKGFLEEIPHRSQSLEAYREGLSRRDPTHISEPQSLQEGILEETRQSLDSQSWDEAAGTPNRSTGFETRHFRV